MHRANASRFAIASLLLHLARAAAAAPVDEPGAAHAPAAATARSDALSRNVEWVGMNLGGGLLYLDVDDYDPADNANSGDLDRVHWLLKTDVLLFNLHWPRIYWTALELHPLVFLGHFGGGTRLGARIPLSDDRRHELRVGAYAGMDFVMIHINAVPPTLSLAPHAQYLYNTRLGSVGAGLDLAINVHFEDKLSGSDGRGSSVPPVLVGVMLYFRWTVGRTVW